MSNEIYLALRFLFTLGWWYVSNCDVEGWFPSTLLEPSETDLVDKSTIVDVTCTPEEVHPITHDKEKERMFPCLAHTAYCGSSEDEVSFARGANVEVLTKSSTGWWKVRYTCMHPVMTISL